MQPFEPGAKLLGKKVGHDAHELADLDEQPLELDDGALDSNGIEPVDLADSIVVPGRAEEPPSQRDHEIGEDHLKRRQVSANEPVALHARAPSFELGIRLEPPRCSHRRPCWKGYQKSRAPKRRGREHASRRGVERRSNVGPFGDAVVR